MRNNKGFTLIELLIVIGIISVLVVVLALAILPWLSKSDENNTKTILQTINSTIGGHKGTLTIEQFKKDAGQLAMKIDSNDDVAHAQMLLFYIAPSREVWEQSAKYGGTNWNPPVQPETISEFIYKDDASRLPHLVDAWGKPIVFSYDRPSKTSFVYSFGPDMTKGNDDDLMMIVGETTVKTREELKKK